MCRTDRTTTTAGPADAAENMPGEQVAEAGPRKRQRRKREDVARMNLEYPPELDFRLSGIASILRIRKTSLVLKLLDSGCKGYKIDARLKATYAETQGQDVSAA